MPKTKTKTTESSTPDERRASNRARIELEFPGLLDYLAPWLPDFDAQLADLTWPRHRSPALSTKERAAGYHFSIDRTAHFLRFCTQLRHIKGRSYAGRPFIPDLWQIVHVLAPVFGTLDGNGLRKYVDLYLEVPRKNGKSTLVAAIGLYLLTADREPGAEIYSIARDRDQAKAVWLTGAQMARAAPALRRRLYIPPNPERRGDRIVFAATQSVWTVLGRDQGGAANKHHGLNIHGALIDELHTIHDAELIGTIETGTGSRDQPLTVIITTAGIAVDSPLWADRNALAVSISAGITAAPRSWHVIFAADPARAADGTWTDEAAFREANPGYGRSVTAKYLANMAAKAQASPKDRARFLRLHLGIPTDSVTAFVALSAWDSGGGLVLESDLEGQPCYGGLDLARSTDLAALVLVFPAADGAFDVITRCWTPADTMHERAEKDRASYPLWAAEGHLLTTPGATIDYDDLEAELVRLARRFDIRAINYDRWGAKQIRDHLEAAGILIWDMGQGFASMSPPLKLLEALILEGKIRHGGHPVLRYCASGMAVHQDPAGNIKPARDRSTSRIDAMVALTMAVDAYVRRDPTESVYDDRGIATA